MYTGRMEEEKIEEMFDEVSTECCVSVCVCVCALVHEDCVTVHEWTHCGSSHTERERQPHRTEREGEEGGGE